MSLRRIFFNTIKTASRSATLVFVCSRCGATKTPGKKTPKAKQLPLLDSLEPAVDTVEITANQQVPGVKNITYGDLECGAVLDEETSSLIPQSQREKNVFSPSTSFPGELYIGRQSLADRIADLMSISPEDDCFLMEGNPGMGLLTQAILSKGAKKLRVFENRAIFVYKLQSLQKLHGPERLEIVCPYNVYDYRRKSAKSTDRQVVESLKTVISPPTLLAAQSLLESPSSELRFEDLVNQDRLPTDWSRPVPAMKYVGIVPPRIENIFIQRIINHVARRKGYASLGRPEFFLILTNREEAILTARPDPETSFRVFRWVTVVAQTLFDIAVLQDVPRIHLLPPVSKKKQHSAERCRLVRLTAKPDLDNWLDPSLLPEYVFFVHQAMMARRRPIIAWLESWIPGSGRRLIDMGKTLYVRTGDLCVQDYMDIFQQIVRSPEYPSSTLKVAFLSSGQLGVPETEDDDLEDDPTASAL